MNTNHNYYIIELYFIYIYINWIDTLITFYTVEQSFLNWPPPAGHLYNEATAIVRCLSDGIAWKKSDFCGFNIIFKLSSNYNFFRFIKFSWGLKHRHTHLLNQLFTLTLLTNYKIENIMQKIWTYACTRHFLVCIHRYQF